MSVHSFTPRNCRLLHRTAAALTFTGIPDDLSFQQDDLRSRFTSSRSRYQPPCLHDFFSFNLNPVVDARPP